MVDVYFFHRMDDLNDNNNELKLRLQQQQPNSTDKINNDIANSMNRCHLTMACPMITWQNHAKIIPTCVYYP